MGVSLKWRQIHIKSKINDGVNVTILQTKTWKFQLKYGDLTLLSAYLSFFHKISGLEIFFNTNLFGICKIFMSNGHQIEITSIVLMYSIFRVYWFGLFCMAFLCIQRWVQFRVLIHVWYILILCTDQYWVDSAKLFGLDCIGVELAVAYR